MKFKKGDLTNKGMFKGYSLDGVTCSVEETIDNGKTRIHICYENELSKVKKKRSKKSINKDGFENVFIKFIIIAIEKYIQLLKYQYKPPVYFEYAKE